ncbi:unnamed protein product [Cuscuta epithymum]|uniref:ATP-dependent DNA helicase n=1 Tax=Cuscuta epithymum TaxID=186058 RepID=A0AAV0DDY7_9ASTE|nr:unnamed protein product [Cuscuta epithymum]
MGGKQDKDINQVKTPPIFRINGQNYHRIGSLLPRDGGQPKFLQMYLCDPSEETSNRLKAVSFKIKNSISVALRSKGQIVLNVASSGIASLLLPGGRTAHSRFAIPLDATEDSTCHIKHGSPLARLIERTRLIIWDESPMTHRAILAPTIDERDMINDYMLGLTLGEVKTYLSSDSASSDSDSALLQEIHSPEFLNTIKCSGVPSHELKLKVGAPVMLMRNIDHPPDCVMAHASSSLNLELIFSRLR